MTRSDLDSRGLPPNYPFNEDWELTPRQLKAMLDAGQDVVVIDCRTPQEYEVARIEGAKLVPMQEAPARLEELRDFEDERVVVHCHHGQRSLRVTAWLREQGFEDVKSLAGGIDLWSVDIDPSVPRY